MGTDKIIYALVGRCMDGKEVTAYYIVSEQANKAKTVSREQLAYLVGREQIKNCEAQLYQDKVLFRGKGIAIEQLPIVKPDGTLVNAMGKVRKDITADEAVMQINLIASIVKGRNVIGYKVRNAGNEVWNMSREEVIERARKGLVGNARVQYHNNKPKLRGVDGVNLGQLMRIDYYSTGGQ